MTDDPTPVATPTPPAAIPTRRIIGASFDLLARTNAEMRSASFYVGLVMLATVGPFIVSLWWLGSAAVHLTIDEAQALLEGPYALWTQLLVWPAIVGFLIVAIQGRAMAIAILGARMMERPFTRQEAVVRSRRVFWRVLAAGILTGLPITIATRMMENLIDDLSSIKGQAALPAAIVVTIVVGAPLGYVLAGVVLGNAGPLAAIRRSLRLFRTRMLAAIVVALLESAAVLLIAFGLLAGLDLVGRLLDTLGIGVDSGPAGLAVVSIGLLAASFALGTLFYTVFAIALAPQVVMFVSLTGVAAASLDGVGAGGHDDPVAAAPGGRPFRVFTRPLLAVVVVAWVGLAGIGMQLLS